MQEKVSIMCAWCGWENPSRGRSAAEAVTRLAGHQEHIKDTYILAMFQFRIDSYAKKTFRKDLI